MPGNSSRLGYIDWMRGLACVLMFQTHCYDSWLGGDARKTTFFMWSQLGGTLPAPLFLFLAGISFALVTDKLRQKQASAGQIAGSTIRRGAEILGLGTIVSTAGIPDRLSVGAMDGFAPRGCVEHDRLVHDVDGCACWAVVSVGKGSRLRLGLVGIRRRSDDFTIESPRVDDVAPGPAAMADRVLYQRRSQPWHAAGLAIPIFPWTAFAFVGLASRIFPVERLGTEDRRWSIRNLRCRRAFACSIYRDGSMHADSAGLSRLRLLAYKSEFLSIANRNALDDSGGSVRLGVAGARDSGDLAHSSNWVRLPCSFTGCTWSLYTGGHPSCRRR